MAIKIISFNCRSARASSDVIGLLADRCEILLLQETLLNDDNHSILNSYSDFNYAYIPSTRQNDNFYGRSSGGLAILWKNLNNINITPLYYSNRIMGLKLRHNDVIYIILNIYLIYDNGSTENLLEYISNLSEMNNILAEETFDHILIGGDFNCDPEKGRFFHEASKFSKENALLFGDILNLPIDSYSYISENSICSTSWIDHFLISDSNVLGNFVILYGATFADHIPIQCELFLPCDIQPKPQPLIDNNNNRFLVEWSKCSTDDKNCYSLLLDNLIDDLDFDTTYCQDINCNDLNHRLDLDKIFEDLKHCILQASKYTLPSISNRGKFRIIPGWNENCRDLYYKARDDFLLWNSLGRIRTGIIFQAMKDSRKSFKEALNYCKANETQIRKEKIINSYNEKSKIQFWKNVRQFTPKNDNWLIDGKTNSFEIATIFTDKYKQVLDNAACHSSYANIECETNRDIKSNLFFHKYRIIEAITELNQGIGFDGIHTNHVKFAGPTFINFLGRIFASCLRHSYLPYDLIKGVIKPVLKGTTCKSKSENFRPVMNSSVFLKILEYCFIPILKQYLKIDSLQFGFQHGSSCDHAITAVKETILNYKKGNTNVHAAAIDLTKAYDRVNHDILINKLLDAGTPILIVKLLQYMLENTYACVEINGTHGDSFRIRNGVRQGGCSSSILFAYYIDQVLIEVKNTGIGCKLSNETVNIIAFADDIILMSPTYQGLKKLFERACEIIDKLCLKININKSKYIIFKHKRTVRAHNILRIQNLTLEKVASITYLGVILSEDLDLGCDVDRLVKSFLGQFNSMINKFNFLSGDVLGFLFKTYCCSFYGVNLWFENLKMKDLRKIEIVFHKAVKKVVNMRNWESNHDACDKINILSFKHIISQKLICCYNSFINTECKFFTKLRYYIMLSSHMYLKIKYKFDSMYGVPVIINNDFAALKSRIAFMHRTEPRSNHVYEP